MARQSARIAPGADASRLDDRQSDDGRAAASECRTTPGCPSPSATSPRAGQQQRSAAASVPRRPGAQPGRAADHTERIGASRRAARSAPRAAPGSAARNPRCGRRSATRCAARAQRHRSGQRVAPGNVVAAARDGVAQLMRQRRGWTCRGPAREPGSAGAVRAAAPSASPRPRAAPARPCDRHRPSVRSAVGRSARCRSSSRRRPPRAGPRRARCGWRARRAAG